MVVLTSLCPSNSCTVRISYPSSRRRIKIYLISWNFFHNYSIFWKKFPTPTFVRTAYGGNKLGAKLNSAFAPPQAVRTPHSTMRVSLWQK